MKAVGGALSISVAAGSKMQALSLSLSVSLYLSLSRTPSSEDKFVLCRRLFFFTSGND